MRSSQVPGYIAGTVTDLAPLRSLSVLERLILSRTPVSNIAPLAALTTLKQPPLEETQVSALGPLAGMARLEA